MRTRFWFMLSLLGLLGVQVNSYGGEPLKKLLPLEKRTPVCPPVTVPCPEIIETDGEQSGSSTSNEQSTNSGSANGEVGGDVSDLQPLPPDAPDIAGYGNRGRRGVSSDRSSYSSLQTLTSHGDFFAPDGQAATINTPILSAGSFSNQPLSGGGGLGRFKSADSNSPIPRDRVFIDYSLFHNARLTPNDINIQRFVPGVERTFMDGLTSLELRLPIAMTLNSASFSDSSAVDPKNTEFGNIAISAKGILWSTDGFVLTSGLVLQTPTADDIVFGNSQGEEAVVIRNTQYRLLPYIATAHYNDEWFWQNYIQIDTAANGNKVYVNNNGQQFDQIGVLEEQNYLYLDTSLSRWLRRDRRRQTGIAMTFELHYNSTLNNSDTVNINDNRGFVELGTSNVGAQIVNMNIGPTFLYGSTTTTVSYCNPLSEDRGFDGELRILLNRLF